MYFEKKLEFAKRDSRYLRMKYSLTYCDSAFRFLLIWCSTMSIFSAHLIGFLGSLLSRKIVTQFGVIEKTLVWKKLELMKEFSCFWLHKFCVFNNLSWIRMFNNLFFFVRKGNSIPPNSMSFHSSVKDFQQLEMEQVVSVPHSVDQNHFVIA